MKMKYPTIKSYQQGRRTFEGKTDPTKNDDPITSKYMTSKKYWLRLRFIEGYESIQIFRNWKELHQYHAQVIFEQGKPM